MARFVNTLILTGTREQAEEINAEHDTGGLFVDTYARAYQTQIIGMRVNKVILRGVSDEQRNWNYEQNEVRPAIRPSKRKGGEADGTTHTIR